MVRLCASQCSTAWFAWFGEDPNTSTRTAKDQNLPCPPHRYDAAQGSDDADSDTESAGLMHARREPSLVGDGGGMMQLGGGAGARPSPPLFWY